MPETRWVPLDEAVSRYSHALNALSDILRRGDVDVTARLEGLATGQKPPPGFRHFFIRLSQTPGSVTQFLTKAGALTFEAGNRFLAVIIWNDGAPVDGAIVADTVIFADVRVHCLQLAEAMAAAGLSRTNPDPSTHQHRRGAWFGELSGFMSNQSKAIEKLSDEDVARRFRVYCDGRRRKSAAFPKLPDKLRDIAKRVGLIRASAESVATTGVAEAHTTVPKSR